MHLTIDQRIARLIERGYVVADDIALVMATRDLEDRGQALTYTETRQLPIFDEYRQRAVEALDGQWPNGEFCHRLPECRGRGSCPRDIACTH